MTNEAGKHLAKAREYVARGEEFYRKAAEEIVAAQKVDPTLSNREIGEWFGKSKDWVSRIVQWSTSGEVRATPWADDSPIRAERAARQVLRETPEIVTQLDPSEQRRISIALDQESAKRQKQREHVSKQKEREHLGDEAVAGLELKEELQSTEYLLIKARGNLRGFVEHVGELGANNTPEAWRESCVDWLNDLEGHIGMAKALLAGDEIDWSRFEELLEKGA